MKRLSIRAQLTLYYGCIMSLLAIVLLGMLYFYASYEIRNTTENKLYYQVHQAMEEITIRNQEIHFSNDLMKLEDGVYLSVYNDQHELMYGRVPYVFQCEHDDH